MDIIIVDNMVREGPLTIFNIPITSDQETMPVIKTIAAPKVVGTVSFIPSGLHSINRIVNVKTINISVRELSSI
jgi:hypothetical protein